MPSGMKEEEKEDEDDENEEEELETKERRSHKIAGMRNEGATHAADASNRQPESVRARFDCCIRPCASSFSSSLSSERRRLRFAVA